MKVSDITFVPLTSGKDKGKVTVTMKATQKDIQELVNLMMGGGSGELIEERKEHPEEKAEISFRKLDEDMRKAYQTFVSVRELFANIKDRPDLLAGLEGPGLVGDGSAGMKDSEAEHAG